MERCPHLTSLAIGTDTIGEAGARSIADHCPQTGLPTSLSFHSFLSYRAILLQTQPSGKVDDVR